MRVCAYMKDEWHEILPVAIFLGRGWLVSNPHNHSLTKHSHAKKKRTSKVVFSIRPNKTAPDTERTQPDTQFNAEIVHAVFFVVPNNTKRISHKYVSVLIQQREQMGGIWNVRNINAQCCVLYRYLFVYIYMYVCPV